MTVKTSLEISNDISKPEQLITEHIDIWTSAILAKSTSGRGSSKKYELYGITKLRELILELAVRGKLVPQDDNDEPASVLLEKIAAEKAQLIKEKKIKKTKADSEVSEDEKFFELPNSWQWTRLNLITEINPRNTDVDDKTKASFVPMTLITTSYDGVHDSESRPWSEIKKGYTHFANGDIAIAKITPCFENSKAAIFRNLENGIGAGTTELHVARPFGDQIESNFLLLYFKSPNFLTMGQKLMTGSAGHKRVPRSFFESNPIPLPPLAEQKRIVAKVDELMLLCDQLEQQTEASIEAHATLVEVLLSTLTDSADADELAQNWARIADHFDSLFTTEQSIEALKQTVLQLAVMGKLVPQNPDDEPASVLLEKIAEEKEQLIKEKRIRDNKSPAKNNEASLNCELPLGWTISCFGDITFNRDPERVPLSVDVRRNRQGSYDYYGASGVIDQIDDFLFDKPLLLIGEDGANLVNRSTPIAFIARGKYWVNNHAHVIDGINEALLLYLSIYINSISLKPYITGTAQPKMNQAKMNSILVMLPPLAEQHRIVTKVDELMAICDQLKEKLQQSQETQVQLTDALVDQALG